MQHASPLNVTSTGSFPRRQRFSYWADAVTQTFVPLQCDTSDPAGFFGNLRHRQIGLIGVTEVHAATMLARRTRATIASAPRDDAIVVVQLAGTCRAGQELQTAELRSAGSAIVCAEAPYFFDFPDAFRQLVIKLPRSLLSTDRGKAPALDLELSGVGAGLLRRLALASLAEPRAFSADEEIGIERAFADLVYGATTRPETASHPADELRLFTPARRFIRRSLADPALSPAIVAAHLQTSTRTLARHFARQGTTIERLIWSERLAAARRDLADTRRLDRSITDIAFAWAFSDAAHFSRRFSRAYGTSPAVYRASLHARPKPRR